MLKSDSLSITALKKRIRVLITVFIVALVFSGITAFPIEWELRVAHTWIQQCACNNDLTSWFERTYTGITDTNTRYPFISYGTDWLAFAHLMIAIVFIGPLRDPVRNIWVIEFGMIACVCIFPLAFIAGGARGIPIFWRILDCSFGIIGGLLLAACYIRIKQLEQLQTEAV
jgi:hypothetical protein